MCYMRAKKKVKITKGEKLLYSAAVVCFVATFVVRIFFGANVGALGIQVEKLKVDLSDQEKKNESLTMKVNELTSFSKVDEVVKEMGLVYNYENIVNIDK